LPSSNAAQLPAEYQDLYDNGLDDLEWSLVSPYESDDDDSIDANSHKQPNMTGLVKLPFPTSEEDIWVPLQPNQLAQFPTGVPYLVETQNTITQPSSKRRRRDLQNVLGRSFGLYDVVFPAEGCTVAMEEKMNNLFGNRHYQKIVSKSRFKYAQLHSIDEKIALAKELVRTVTYSRKGSFYKATVRKVDGMPMINLCSDIDEVTLQNRHETNEVLTYTIFRLEKGFPDVLHPTLLSSSFVLSTLSGRNGGKNRCNSTDAPRTDVGNSKIERVEHAPMLGLLHGGLVWSTRSLNECPKLKLRNLKNSDASALKNVGLEEVCDVVGDLPMTAVANKDCKNGIVSTTALGEITLIDLTED
jgi:hypothetical protein